MASSRKKGYAPWNPKAQSLELVRAVEHVLDEYSDHLPLTARQIFYRLVGTIGYEKTEQAYARLCEALVKARRAQMIPFDAIRDDGTREVIPQTFADVDAFWARVEQMRQHYVRNRLAGQDCRVELWCEAAGMTPQLQRVAFPYSVPVYSTGGFSSVTVTHEIAQRAMEFDVPTVFLHVGDYDPSGESIFEAMSWDARKFLIQGTAARCDDDDSPWTAEEVIDHFNEHRQMPDGLPDLRPVRVALTGEQVDEHGLETAPPKRTDSRSRSWVGETAQAEAMPPDILADTIDAAIRAEIDIDRYTEECECEAPDEEVIDTVLTYAKERGS